MISFFLIVIIDNILIIILNFFVHVVTTIAISEDGRTIVTGTKCSNLLSWKVNLTDDNEFLNIEHKPLHAFYGHDDEVSFVI